MIATPASPGSGWATRGRRVRAAAVIPAGGSGARMGPMDRRTAKQYRDLAGETVLARALRPFLEHAAFEWVVVVLPPDDVDDPPVRLPEAVTVVGGGATRSESVRAGLDAVPDAADVVLIHDGARPLLTRAVVDRVLEAAAGGVGAVAALPVVDTLKRIEPGGTVVAHTVDRTGLWRAQTPQGFPRALIVDAYRRSAEEGWVATDDAALVERCGGRVKVVEGDPRNVKITHAEDLALAELLLTLPTP